MVSISRLDPSTIKPGSVILCCARRNSGKSVLMRDILYHMRKQIDVTLVMTPTQSSADMFKEHVPGSLVWMGLDMTIIERLLETQRACLQEGKRARNVLLVLDDLSYDAKAFRAKGNVLGDLWRNGRHAKISVLCSAQTALDLGPDLRANTDIIFALKEPILANRNKLHQAYFGQLDFSSFNRCFLKATADYGAMVLNNTLPETDVEAIWSWYKASLKLPSFRCGADTYWKIERHKQKTRGSDASKAVITIPNS